MYQYEEDWCLYVDCGVCGEQFDCGGCVVYEYDGCYEYLFVVEFVVQDFEEQFVEGLGEEFDVEGCEGGDCCYGWVVLWEEQYVEDQCCGQVVECEVEVFQCVVDV